MLTLNERNYYEKQLVAFKISVITLVGFCASKRYDSILTLHNCQNSGFRM